MNIPNLGKYASVGDLKIEPQRINYHRGYGNILVHTVAPNNDVATQVSKFNRIEPLKLPFGEHLPLQKSMDGYQMFNPQTTLAWSNRSFFQ